MAIVKRELDEQEANDADKEVEEVTHLVCGDRIEDRFAAAASEAGFWSRSRYQLQILLRQDVATLLVATVLVLVAAQFIFFPLYIATDFGHSSSDTPSSSPPPTFTPSPITSAEPTIQPATAPPTFEDPPLNVIPTSLRVEVIHADSESTEKVDSLVASWHTAFRRMAPYSALFVHVLSGSEWAELRVSGPPVQDFSYPMPLPDRPTAQLIINNITSTHLGNSSSGSSDVVSATWLAASGLGFGGSRYYDNDPNDVNVLVVLATTFRAAVDMMNSSPSSERPRS